MDKYIDTILDLDLERAVYARKSYSSSSPSQRANDIEQVFPRCDIYVTAVTPNMQQLKTEQEKYMGLQLQSEGDMNDEERQLKKQYTGKGKGFHNYFEKHVKTEQPPPLCSKSYEDQIKKQLFLESGMGKQKTEKELKQIARKNLDRIKADGHKGRKCLHEADPGNELKSIEEALY